MPRVLIADDLSPRAVALLRGRGIEVDIRTGLSQAELEGCIAGYDGLAVRAATRVTAGIVEAAGALKVVGRAGTGVGNIDLAAATRRGIVVMNTPQGSSITAAEHAIAMMMALARRIPAADRSTRAGKWETARFTGVELTGKTLGIVGCGTVGSIVAERAQGLRMKVIVHDPFLSAERARHLQVAKVELEELLARADFASLHTPLTDATRNLIDARRLAKAKPGLRLVNCARGGLVVEADLAAAIESGRVAGAALDVFAEEPARGSPLFDLEAVIVTPHIGAATAEAEETAALQIAEQMADFLLTRTVRNALNMPAVAAEDVPRLWPYMALARQLGRFVGQLARSGLKAVMVEYEGHAAALDVRPLTAIVLTELLAPALDSVNMVNAGVLARERNVAVSEVTHDRPGDYSSLIRLAVTTDRRRRDLAGTLSAGGRPRLVEIGGIRIEAELGRYMLYVTNEDKPGFIGRLGTVLGRAGVNIANFHLGRAAPGGEAVALVEIEAPLSEAVLGEIRAIPGVVQAAPLSF